MRILFVSHDATRTGAPIVLLNLLKWIRKTNACEFSVFLQRGGDLEAAFQGVANTYYTYCPPPESGISRIGNKALKKLKLYKKPENVADIFSPELLLQQFDVIYLNTVDTLHLAPFFKQAFRCPIIAHIHENEYSIKAYYPLSLSQENISNIDHFIAVSGSTKDNLVKNYYINAQKISLVYEFIDISMIQAPSIAKNDVKKSLGLKDEFIVGASGLTSWRKGADIFVQLALALKQQMPADSIKLVWVGAIDDEFRYQYEYEKERLGLDDILLFIGQQQGPQNYYQIFDVFVLTSREDPFPLVTLESAALEKPVICFSSSGGIPEISNNENDGIKIVPYGDVQAMAQQILFWQVNKQELAAAGRSAKEICKDYNVGDCGKKIFKIINQILNA